MGTLCRSHFPKIFVETTEVKVVKRSGFAASELRAVLRRNNSRVNDYNRWILLHHRANMDLQFICNPHGTAMYACMYSSKAGIPDSQVIQKQVLKMFAKEEAAGLHEMTRKKLLIFGKRSVRTRSCLVPLGVSLRFVFQTCRGD